MRFQHWTPLWVARVHPFSHHNIQDKRRPVIKLTKLLYSCFRDKAKEDSFEVGFARCLTRSGSGLTKQAEKRIRWTDKTMNFLLFRKIYYIAIYLYDDRIIRGTVVAKRRRDWQQKDGGIFGYMTYIFICLMCSNLIVMLFINSKFKTRQQIIMIGIPQNRRYFD